MSITPSTVPHRLVHQLYQLTKENISMIFLEIIGFIVLILDLVVAKLVKGKEQSIDPKIEFCRQKLILLLDSNLISLEKMPNRLRGLLEKYYAIFLQFFYKIFGTFVENVWNIFGKYSTKTAP